MKSENNSTNQPYSLRQNPIYIRDNVPVTAMSVSELRATGQFDNLRDGQLLTMMDTVRTFTEIVYEAWSKTKGEALPANTLITLNTNTRKAA